MPKKSSANRRVNGCGRALLWFTFSSILGGSHGPDRVIFLQRTLCQSNPSLEMRPRSTCFAPTNPTDRSIDRSMHHIKHRRPVVGPAIATTRPATRHKLQTATSSTSTTHPSVIGYVPGLDTHRTIPACRTTTTTTTRKPSKLWASSCCCSWPRPWCVGRWMKSNVNADRRRNVTTD